MNPSEGASKQHIKVHWPLTAVAFFLKVADEFQRTPASLLWPRGLVKALDKYLAQGWNMREIESETGINRAEIRRASLTAR